MSPWQRNACGALLLFSLFWGPSLVLARLQDNPQDLCPSQLQAQQISIPGPLADKLSEIISSHWQKSDSPGISLSVVSGDKIVWEWNGGFTSLNRTQRVNSQTRFRLASITKAFTSTLLFQLVSRGVIQSADDRIKNYIPDFHIIDPFRRSGSPTASQLTFRQLAAHLAGLPREPPCSWEDCQYSTQDMLKLVSSVPLIVKPNSRVSYSNLGFNLLGHGLGEYTNWADKTANKTWEALLKHLIIDQIGLQNTGVFHDMSDAQGNFAYGYSEGQQVKLYDLAWNNPAGGMVSTTEDLSKYLIALMSDDESKALMDTYTRDSFFQPIFMTRDNLGVWGAPWEGQRRGEYTVLRKGGGLPGYSTFISFVPEFKLGVSILMNSGTMAAEDLTFDLWTVLLPYLQSTLPVEPVKTATPALLPFVGVWMDESGLKWNFTLNATSSYISFTAPPYYYNGPGYLIPSKVGNLGGQVWAQTYHPDNTIPCFRNLMGLNFEYFVYESSPAEAIRMPFFFPARVFYRVK
eukprot:TRINITY_DN2340_c0_g2_i1.p1 TRINITY_DN2340_c0_g2~~TRINITY_DN2340_c0_g2_i1.p1  ORF type:complete len:518 (-),score=45.83 TRINITY_DN2340_c0_g2_i1:25-1578(-)